MKCVALAAILFSTSACTILPGKKPAEDESPAKAPDDGDAVADLFRFNIVTRTSLTLSGSSTQGRMATRGNATLKDFAVATTMPEDAKRCDLIAGGDVTITRGSIQKGKICVRGKIDSSALGAKFQGSSTLEPNPDALVNDATTLSERLGTKSPIESFTATQLNGSRGTLVLTGEDPKLNVFEISADAGELLAVLKIQVPEASIAVVNFTGKTITLRDFGMSTNNGKGGLVVLNFPEAESLKVKDAGVLGTILAPYALVKFRGGSIMGEIVADELETDAKFDNRPFVGSLN